ncbi:MAG: DNA polymerase I [Dehalococcoidia bacterium]
MNKKTTSENENKSLLILIDGHALIHRAFHAIQQPLTVSTSGEDVRGVYGFINAFIRALSELKPTHVAITFDLSAPTFRHKMFDEYKAHRAPTPPELRTQFDRVRQAMSAFEVPIYEMEGYEADDLLGTLSKQAEDMNLDTVILTGDSDTLQLVSEHTKVFMTSSFQRSSMYDIEAVKERYGGLGPEFVSQIKALQGDSSDNIPGIPGIGIKTAIKLLSDFGSIQGIYENLKDVTPPRAKKNLSENIDVAEKSQVLTKIVRDAPVTLNLSTSEFGAFDRNKVVDLFRELEFHSIIPKIPIDNANLNNDTENQTQLSFLDEKIATEYVVVDNEKSLTDLVTKIEIPTGFSFDTETTSTNPMNCELVGISISIEPHKGWYIPVGHKEGAQIDKNIVVAALKPIFENRSVPKRAHNANFDMMVLMNNDIKVEGLSFDTMVAAHLSGRRNWGLKELALECFGEEMTPIKNLIGTGKSQITMAEVPIEEASEYATADADFTERLHEMMRFELEQKDISKLFEEVEVPLIPILVAMQRNGLKLNEKLLGNMSITIGQQLDEIKSEMFELIGHEFNLNSPKQLNELLFSELKLPPTRKTKSGYSTDAQALEDLKIILDRGDSEDSDPRSYEVLNRILEHRELAKIKSTYIDALPTMINKSTGRVHTSYRQTGTTTGRLSSNDPNVQNIPVRTELGRKVREAFVAENPEENLLLAADYSQIELRVLAHLSKDLGLVEAFHRGEDIHSATSSMVYGIPIESVTPDMRRIAKVLNFGVIYGLSPHGIARQTDLTQKEGKEFIDIYFSKYPGILNYLDSVKSQCHSSGYIETLFGRRRYLPEINSKNFHLRTQAERAAINMPIQGTAADIIKIAMINIDEQLTKLGMKSKMILQVHDELIFEVPKKELHEMESLVGELMPSAVTLEVPIEIEMKKGLDWGNLS